MLLPYRTKNPPEYFPYVTVSLIAINILIYICTSSQHNFLRVDDSALESLAVTHNNLSLWRLTSAMFLHANFEHILGNMLFLWIFGAATEGRLRPLKYLILYFAAGWTGGLLSDFVQGLSNPDMPSLGASGAIMGVAGAYLYLFPHSIICVFYTFSYRAGVADWQAWWVVLVYVGMDIVFGLLFKGADGVGHFAHLGGFGTGLLIPLLLRARRDTEETSQARATLADTRDFTTLDTYELEAMMQHPTENMELVMASCERLLSFSDPHRQMQCVARLTEYAPKLFTQIDPVRLASLLLYLPTSAGAPPLVYYLRLGAQLESRREYQMALQIYYRIHAFSPMASENEMALFRTGQMMTRIFNDRGNAQSAYRELLRLFPHGHMALQAQQELQKIS